MKLKIVIAAILTMIAFMRSSCSTTSACHEEMISILQKTYKKINVQSNPYYPASSLTAIDSLLNLEHSTPSEKRYCQFMKAKFLMELGEEKQAIEILEGITNEDQTVYAFELIWKELGIAYLRQGERANCISNHAAESCIMPIKGMGVHKNIEGSQKAITVYKKLLEKNPNDLESRWLLNIAYMTLGKYPDDVPSQFFIPNMEGDTTYKVNAFQDIAADLKLDVKNMAGGSIVEDFDNDGYLDIMTSSMDTEEKLYYFKNNADGTFSNLSDKVGLQGISGGLNIMQTDYNNDGYKDVFILRGAWKGEYGEEPQSLLRNNGNGTFTDVTTESGLLSLHPTQTATWNDFNNDGWLDLFVGAETAIGSFKTYPCEFYINNHDGTFREVSAKAHCNLISFVKGVTSGDYNHDGWKDIFISTMNGKRILLKNNGLTGDEVSFTDVTTQAGLDHEKGNSFPTWFWDYDNDGWLDIFVCDYTFNKSLAYYAAAEKLNIVKGNQDKMMLYRNNHDGTFTNVAPQMGLTQKVFAMGSNFGDIDNDGYLDMYLGTGNPNYQSLVPNKMFKNIDGKKFVDVTTSARVGHLQKGHAVSFADMDNDGDQDVYIEMGGAYLGDAYQNSFFLNPGQGNNNWICLDLEGTQSNRSAVGTQVKLTFKENGVSRSVYRDVNSGGSFGSSPLRREIGIGQATIIDEIEIRWHGSGQVQIFKNVKPNQFLKIAEGKNDLKQVPLKKIIWTLPDKLCLPSTSTAIVAKK